MNAQAFDTVRDEWLSRSCFCGRLKREREMFCFACYVRLTQALRKELAVALGRPQMPAVVAKLKAFLAPRVEKQEAAG